MPKRKKKKSKLQLKKIILAIVIIAITLLGLMYFLRGQTKVNNDTEFASEASQLAFVLLNQKEVEDILQMKGQIFPGSVQFNGNLDQPNGKKDKDYIPQETFIARSSTLRTDVSKQVFVDTIVLFANNEDAMFYLNKMAKGTSSKVAYLLGGAVPAETAAFPTTKDGSGYVEIRFVVNNIGARVEVDGDAKTAQEAEALLMPKAKEAAKKLEGKIEAFQNGTLQTDFHNSAETLLPTQIANTTFLGKTIESEDEYMSGTGENSIPGYTQAATERFKINAQPGEAVDVSVIIFDTEKNAQSYLSTFNDALPNGPQPVGLKAVELPDSLKKYGGRANSQTGLGGLVEFQGVKGNHFYDVIIESPYFSLNLDRSRQDIVTISEEVMNKVQ